MRVCVCFEGSLLRARANRVVLEGRGKGRGQTSEDKDSTKRLQDCALEILIDE